MNATVAAHSAFWHPCVSAQDLLKVPPLPVKRAQGAMIELTNGKQLIDCMSSWWCKPLGHNHPRIKAAIVKQAEQFEHVITANTTYPVLEALSERLTQMTHTLDKVFYASDGSCAVEIAIKMSVHYHALNGQPQRNKIMSLSNGYHGETLTTLAISDLDIYKAPYQHVLKQWPTLTNIPYVHGITDPRWSHWHEQYDTIEKQLTPHKNTLAAIILEPILQAAGGMKVYSPQLLKFLRRWCTQHNVHLIADEIATGFGRTGLPLACEHANIEPDFLCLGKALTAGWLPMSAVLASNAVYETLNPEDNEKMPFLHSHTFSGHALSAAAALETFKVFQDEGLYEGLPQLAFTLKELFHEIAHKTGKLQNIRCIGGVVAGDLTTNIPKVGLKVFKEAIERGALLRPLGNTIYWFPPLTIDYDTLDQLAVITRESIEKTFHSLAS